MFNEIDDFDSFEAAEGYDSHLAEFDNSDEAVDSYLDFENEIPEADPFEDDMPEADPFAEADEDAEIRRIHRDAFPWD